MEHSMAHMVLQVQQELLEVVVKVVQLELLVLVVRLEVVGLMERLVHLV
jgi:hypothetical protein